MNTNDNKREDEDENEDGNKSPQELHQTKGIDLKNHPVDVQKKLPLPLTLWSKMFKTLN